MSTGPRGWFLIEAEWPLAIVILASNKTTPQTIVVAAQFDYTNYDAEPPSVRFVDPFSGRLLPNADLPIRLFRTVPGPNVPSPDGTKTVTAQDLVQASSQRISRSFASLASRSTTTTLAILEIRGNSTDQLAAAGWFAS